MKVRGLLERLDRDASGDARADRGTRELYAADASLYRRLPAAALRAAHADDIDVAIAASSEFGVPLTMRGGGTSLAGQTVGSGLIVDCSALNDIEIDPDARSAWVGPGVVLADLNAAAEEHGLAFGPDVATASRATLGGMIANNSAGARSIVHGLTADHVRSLDVTLADGTRARLRRGEAPPASFERARSLGAEFAPPALLRRVSGYNLDALSGDQPDWPRLVCGSEGTLCAVRGAEVDLVPAPAARGLALVPYDSVARALVAVPGIIDRGPSAIELLDRALLDPANRPPAVAGLMGHAGLAEAALLVEYSGEPEEVEAGLAGHGRGTMLRSPEQQSAMWAVRRSGIARALGMTEGLAGDPRPIPFIEDPAVPPERLPEFADRLTQLLRAEGVPAVIYGHASVGCLHVRPLIDLRQPGAVAAMRRIAEATADLVVSSEGSLSGEHGDGRARSELLPRMYPAETIDAFASLKRLLDPGALFNPGVLVDPDPLDAHLRLVASPPRRAHTTSLSFAAEGGLARAGEACNGNGACRGRTGGMCPSYQALGDERHSTRGRAVVLRAAIEGRLPAGLADDALHEALDLCLGCKACAAECPAGVDMARLREEALAQRHRARGVPLRARVEAAVPTLLRAASKAPGLARPLAGLASVAARRRLPTPRRAWRPGPPDRDATVALVADTFTRTLHPEIGDAALRVLRAGGARVQVVDPGCCGRPALSAGRVAVARGHARTALDRLAAHAVDGRRIVVLEPSCWSMMRDDMATLVPDDPRTECVAAATTTFAGAVAELDLPPLAPHEARAVVHEHCHARAGGVGGELLSLAEAVPGLIASDSGAGCCGMAGSFGYRHPELSRRVAEDRLLPAIEGCDLVVSDGMSCRSQVAELAGKTAVHPAQLLAEALT